MVPVAMVTGMAIAMKIGPDKPVVGATLVVARSRHQPVFIPLCGLRKAMVIPNAAQPHPVIPNAAQPHPVIPNVAQRSEESKILVLENAPLDRTAQCPQANSPLPPSTPVGRATLVVALPHTQHLAPNTQNPLSHPYAILSTSSAFPHT